MHTIGGSEFNKIRRPSDDLEGNRRSKMVLRDDLPKANPNKVVIKSTGHTHPDNESQETILRAESRQAARPSSNDSESKEADAKGILVTTAFGVENKSTT